MFNKKVLTLVLAVLLVAFLNSPLMAKGQGGSGSSDQGQGKSGDTVTIDDAGGQAQGAGDQAQASADQTQQKQQSKAQEQKKTQKKEQKKVQKKEQKREQKKLQKKEQKKEQKKDCAQDKSQQKSGEQKGKAADEAKGQGKAGAPEEGTAAEKITGKGKIVKTEDGYAIECGDKQYKPLNLQEKYQQEGLEIDFTAEKPAGENADEDAISILEISSSENLEEVPVVSEEQAKEGQIMQEQKGSMKQQGKSKLTNDF